MSEVGYMAHRQKMLHTPALNTYNVARLETKGAATRLNERCDCTAAWSFSRERSQKTSLRASKRNAAW